VKALDTPVLLALLEGDRGARELVRRLRGHEIATTEANLLELALLAEASPRARAARREAIARLRRKLTVLPIDGRAVEEAARRTSPREILRGSPHSLGMLGALEAAGCEELFVDGPLPSGRWRFRMTRVARPKRK
jgi:uncharacterized protein with PIN domain